MTKFTIHLKRTNSVNILHNYLFAMWSYYDYHVQEYVTNLYFKFEKDVLSLDINEPRNIMQNHHKKNKTKKLKTTTKKHLKY